MEGPLREMNSVIKHYKRIIAIAGVVTLFVMQAFVVLPVVTGASDASAETAGDTLEVRVQYSMERGDKVRTKATFSKEELKSMGFDTLYYSNLTAAGGIMRLVAKGPLIADIIKAAGIDTNSVEYVAFRTKDGRGTHKRYSETYYMTTHLQATRWYYPYLHLHYVHNDDMSITPTEGALDDRVPVPAILAIESGSTKYNKYEITEKDLSTKESYRFCLGQTNMQVGVDSVDDDISSSDSAKYIFGMDVVLSGYPPIDGVDISASRKAAKIGSQIRLTANVTGGGLKYENSDLEWTSSNAAIAEVDLNGVVTIKGEGEVTITATAANGISATVVLNGDNNAADEKTDDGKDDNSDKQKKDKDKDTDKKDSGKNSGNSGTDSAKPNSNAKIENKDVKEKETKTVSKTEELKTISVKEITLSAEVEQPSSVQVDVNTPSTDAEALAAAEEYDTGTVAGSAGVALAACIGGVVFRIRRFHIDIGSRK